jgi:hypothetical protein
MRDFHPLRKIDTGKLVQSLGTPQPHQLPRDQVIHGFVALRRDEDYVLDARRPFKGTGKRRQAEAQQLAQRPGRKTGVASLCSPVPLNETKRSVSGKRRCLPAFVSESQ